VRTLFFAASSRTWTAVGNVDATRCVPTTYAPWILESSKNTRINERLRFQLSRCLQSSWTIVISVSPARINLSNFQSMGNKWRKSVCFRSKDYLIRAFIQSKCAVGNYFNRTFSEQTFQTFSINPPFLIQAAFCAELTGAANSALPKQTTPTTVTSIVSTNA